MQANRLEVVAGCQAMSWPAWMACLKGAVIANVVAPTAAYVRFAAHYGFRPDFYEPGTAVQGDRGESDRLCQTRPDDPAVITFTALALPQDRTSGLRRLKLAAMRQLAPELLLTAKPSDGSRGLLRTLVEAEITARDNSNARAQLKTAAFSVVKTMEEFDRSA